MKTLTLTAACALWGTLSSPASAEFVSLKSYGTPGTMFARFDNPNDRLVAVVGLPEAPMDIYLSGGTFYQHAFGTDLPPSEALINAFPSLADDTFVSIGAQTAVFDETMLTPGWPGFGPNSLAGTNLAWFVTPDSLAAIPDPDGRIFVGQFIAEPGGLWPHGRARIQYISGGQHRQVLLSWAGYPICVADLNHDNQFDIEDLLEILGNWGGQDICGQPIDISMLQNLFENWTGGPTDVPSVDADLNADASTDDVDLAILLACFGSTNAKCEGADLNSDGVINIVDLQILLADWS